MTKREEYEQRAEQLLMPVIQANDFELVDVEYVKEAGPVICALILIRKAALPLMTVSW